MTFLFEFPTYMKFMDREYFYAIHAFGKSKITVKFVEMRQIEFEQISSILTISKFEHFDNICK